MTRLSVLLPTRSGGELLGPCLDAALAQENVDLEVIVSDNANTDRTPDVVAQRSADPRLVSLRQPRTLTVTDNWGATVEAARGEYLLMIGDDDLLRPGCLAAIDVALRERRDPDCLTFNAVRYVAPGSVPGVASSLYASPYFEFDERFHGLTSISASLRRDILCELYAFRVPFPLTMQLTCVSRRAALRLRRGLFCSPFPDHYAIGALLATAESWGFWSGRPAIIGVSPKSFGHFFFSGQDVDGLGYLGVEPRFRGMLAGNEVTNASAAWLLALRSDYADLLDDIVVSRAAYVVRQVWAWAQSWRAGRLSSREFVACLRQLSARDIVGLLALLSNAEVRSHGASAARRVLSGGDRSTSLLAGLQEVPGALDITAFAAWLDTPRTESIIA